MTEEITYEIKQLFATYNDLFKDNIDEIINDYDLTRKEKMAEIVEMGKKLDKELWHSHGTTREFYGRLSYEERAKRYVKKMKGGKYGLTKSETIQSMVNAGGTVSEERMPYIIFGLGGVVKSYEIKKISRTVNGKKVFTSDTLDILDAVAHKVYQSYQKSIEKNKKPVCKELESVEELVGFAEFCDKEKFIKFPDQEFNTVVISEGEIRKFVNKPNYSTSQITERVKNIGHFTLEGTVPIFCGKDGWINVPVIGGFAEVWIAKEEERYFKYRSKRKLRGRFGKGREENVFIIRFIGSWGLAYVLNILSNNVTVFPPRFYKDLSANERMMFRAICGKGVSIINIHQINKIFDWEEPMKNVPQRIIRIEKIWKNLYKHGFIKKFTGYKKDGTIYWRVERRKNWFNPPRQIKETD